MPFWAAQEAWLKMGKSCELWRMTGWAISTGKVGPNPDRNIGPDIDPDPDPVPAPAAVVTWAALSQQSSVFRNFSKSKASSERSASSSQARR